MRNGLRAIVFATAACELTGWTAAENLDTLAAAYAEDGDFENAVKWENRAWEITEEKWKEEFAARLKLYQTGQPYREPPSDNSFSF